MDNEHPELPPNVKLVPYENCVYADFEVCPLEPERSGWMQAACIETAKNVFVENF
jgi:hypothetical protein